MSPKNMQIIIAVVAIVGVSVATGLIVHYNDKALNDHAMMESTKMQDAAVKKAASDAAMKQAETDKLAAHDAMMKNDSSTTTVAGQ